MIFNRSYNYNDVLTRASITLQVIEDVAIYKAQLFSSNGNIFSSRDESSDLHVRVFKGFEDITDRFTDIVWKRFTAESGNVEEDTKWGEQHKGKKDIVITKDDIQSKANIQVEVYAVMEGKRTLVAVDFITFIDVNDLQGSTTPPTNPNDGDLWLDTSVMPPRLMVWDANLGMWVEVTVAGNDRRNLIRHSNFYKKNFDYWTSVNSPTLNIESLNAKKWARIKSTTIKNAYCGISQITSAVSKTQYSFQMLSEVYIQSAYPNGNAVVAFYSINDKNIKTLIKEEKFDLTTDPKVFTSSFTTLTDTKKIEVVISGQKDAQFDFIVTNIKLENHPIPTAWELAIEDMQDALDQKVGNTSEEVFDSLTDNGRMQGLYIDIDEHGNKNYYFKGQFIDAKNLRVMNNNGTRTLYINENGNIEIVASSFTLVAGADTNVPTKDEVKDSIDNIQIGVRNLLYKTNSTLRVVGANRENQVVNIGSIKGTVLAGKQITFQFKYKVISESISGTYRPQTGMSSWLPLSAKFETLKKEGEYFHYTITIPTTDKGFNNVEIRFENMQGEIEISDRKVEIGNKPSDWTEAEEDVQARIQQAQQDANTANQNATNAQESANTANNKVNEMSNDNKLTSIEKQSAKLEWDVIAVEKPKIEAEAVKFGVDKTDYVAKYNTLANYLSPLLANLSVTSDIVGDTFRANFKNYYDSRQTLLNAISSKAKDIADSANNKIDNLQIGGQNILPMTKDFSSGWWLGVGGTEAGVTSDVKSIVNKRTNYAEGQPRQQIVYTYKPIVTKGTKFTISGYYYIDTSIPLNGDAGNNNIVLREYEVGSDKMRDFCVVNFDATKVNQWVYFSATGVTNFNQTRDLAFMFSIHKNGYVKLSKPKMEFGNVATDWSQALGDFDIIIAEADKKAQEALNNLTDLSNDNKLTPNEKQQTKKDWDIILGEYPKIISEANKSSVSTTNYTNAYNTLKSYIEPILSNLTTTSDITGVAFRNNFKSYYDNRQDLLNAISTALKNNADNANNKIDNLQIGTRNFLLNTGLRTNTENFAFNAAKVSLETVKKTPNNNNCFYFNSTGETTNRWFWACQNTNAFTIGREYNFSANVFVPTNHGLDGGASLEVICYNKDGGRTLTQSTSINLTKLDVWQLVTLKLTVPSGTTTMQCGPYVVKNGKMYAGDYKLEEGNKPTGWSAAPEDVQSDIDNKVDVGGSIDDINQSPNGQIDYPKLNIRGAISFDDLDSEIGKNFIAKKDSQGNRIQTVINGGAIETGTVTADKMVMYNLNVIRRRLVNNAWQDIDTSFAITDEGKIRASGTFSSFNFKDDADISKSEGWMINEDGNSVFNNSIVRGRVELPNAGVTNSCVPDNEKIDLTKYCRNLLNTPLIVTNPADAIYANSGCPNPPIGMTVNSYDQVANKLKKGEASSNGNCWAIIAAYKAYNNIPDATSKNKLKDIIVKSANFMINNLSVGRFNSMDFKFIDVSYKYNETTKVWERGNYKEIYISSLWLQVRSLLLAYEMTGTVAYKDTALIVLDSLYNMHIYINQKVVEGELPSKLTGASYTFLACDNLSSSNRFSPSRHFGHQIGYYLCQAIEDVIRLVGDSERTTPKGDKYRPSIIVDNYREYLKKAYADGLTTSPTGLPYGCYYRTGTSPNYEYVQGNWDFINGTWGDSWFVGDVVCYTIYSYAKIGLKDIAKEYLDAYYNVRVDSNSSEWGTRFLGDLVFYDRIDFQGNHLTDDKSVSITYTALFYEIARELGVEKYFNVCAKTLYKWQVKSSNKFIDGGYPWDVSKDGQTLELKSYGEIINSECHKRFYIKNNEYVTNDNPVRIWAGTTYMDRENAPCKILQDGTIIATRGEFGGTFTGRLEIGNIFIYDDLTTPGVIEIKNNDNSKTVVKIGEEYSEFNSDIYLGSKSNYLFRTNISNKQLVSGKQSSIRFEYEETTNGDLLSNSLTINGKRIQFNQNEYIYSTNPGIIELGTDSTKGILNIRSSHDSSSDGVLGEMLVNVVGSASISTALNLGNVDLVPVYPEGLDIFVN